MKKIFAIVILGVIIFGVMLLKSYGSVEDTSNYEIHIFEDGSAEIIVDNIGHVNQLSNGTLIIDGGQ